MYDLRFTIYDYSHDSDNRQSSVVGRQSSVIALILLAAALRLGGMLHPHARFSDDGLNANNLIGFTSGQVFFTEGLPSESGGGQAPYPPGQYIVFAPAQLLVRTMPNDINSIRMLLKIGNAVWDSLVVGMCVVSAAALRVRATRGPAGRRAVSASAATAQIALGRRVRECLRSGAGAAAAGAAGDTRERAAPSGYLRRAAGAAGAGAAGAPGCDDLGSMSAWQPGRDLADPRQVRDAPCRLLAFAGALAVALVALFYYTALGDVLIDRLHAPATAHVSLAEKLTREVNRSRDLGLHPLTLALGALGALLLMLSARPKPALGALLAAWWGATLLSLGLLLFANQGVRWQSFLYPALCVGAGPALAALWRRGRAARAVVIVLVVFLLWYGLAFWIVQIRDYLH